MTKADLLKALEDIEPTACVWVQPNTYSLGDNLTPAVVVDVLGDEIATEGANEGDVVIRYKV